jgi:L-arabinose isomerase
LPIIVCDTTPTFSYGPEQDPAELMYNHGIHGVQDLCNLLIRQGKPFQIDVGHWERSDILDRVAMRVQSAAMASHLRKAKVGLIGEPFTGMGDFYVPASQLEETIGIETKILDLKHFRELITSITDSEMAAEEEQDRRRFLFENLDQTVYKRSLRVGLAVQKWIEAEGLSAFSFNFVNVNRAAGFETVPFLQASKMMAAGIGYAGEGDVLTAALVAALSMASPDTSFTEMFCPDWEHNSIYLSHMGEMNYRLSADKPQLLEMDYHYSDAENPVFAVGRFRPGNFLLVNLAPLGGNKYRLIIAPAEMLDVPEQDNMAKRVHGWFRPSLPIADFLASYSKYGGTHHLALTYGAPIPLIEAFGQMMDWETVIIDAV